MSKLVKRDLRGERVGLFTADPGRTTGITASTITLVGDVDEIFKRDPMFYDEINCWDQDVPEFRCEVPGARVVVETFTEIQFKWQVEEGIPTDLQFFVGEDFVLNRDPRSWERSGISPARVFSLIQGMMDDNPVQWVAQLPSVAMQITNDRLRNYGLWNRGDSKTPHALDAKRHAVAWVRSALA